MGISRSYRYDPERFFRFIEPEINHFRSGRKWPAVSFRSVVYCFPDFLWEMAKKLCRDSKALDFTFMCESEKGAAIKLIITTLRQAGFVSDMLPEARYAWKCEVRSKAGNKKFMLTPLKWEHFNLEAAEARKVEYLNTVKVVRC